MRLPGYCSLLLLCLLPVVSAAQETAPAPPAEAEVDAMVEQERRRAAVVEAFEIMQNVGGGRAEGADRLAAAVGKITDLGPAALPFLIPDLESPASGRFFFAVYATGMLGAPGGIEPLRSALAAAIREEGPYGRHRRAWSAFSLALLGGTDAIDQLVGSDAGRMEIFGGMSFLEASAVVTLPESVPVLFAQLDRLLEEPGAKIDAALIVRALRHTGTASARPRCLELMTHESFRIRVECAELLNALGDPRDVDPMLAALKDENQLVRRSAAIYLRERQPKDRIQQLLAHLETEQAAPVRGEIYETLANVMGKRALSVFRIHRQNPDYLDRLWLARAAGLTGEPGALNLLRELLRDDDSRVRVTALNAIARLGTRGARDTVLAALRDSDWPTVQTAIETLSEAEETRAAPRIADLLLNRLLPDYTVTPANRVQVEWMSEALVDLSYTEALEGIREAVKEIDDPESKDLLDLAATRLAAIAACKDDPAKWIERLADPDHAIRELAYERLGAFGDAAAVDALVKEFDDVEDHERRKILEALARAASPRANRLIRRVLVDPEYDLATRAELRGAAAWAARSIGGQQMVDALRESVLRREGQDYLPLHYLAVLAGKDAAPILNEVRVPRIRYLWRTRGYENEKILWMIRELDAGRSIAKLDLPPEQIRFQQ